MFLELIKKPVLHVRRKRLYDQLGVDAQQVDGFLVSFPKSGRTWLRYILSHYFAAYAGLDFEPALNTKFRVLPNLDLEPERGLPVFVGKTDKLPLIAVSHLSYDARLFNNRPVILLVRDTRDVCVSAYFHQTRQKGRFSGTIGEFIENSQYGVPSIIAYLNGWAAQLDSRSSHVVSYENLKADTSAHVAAIVRFIGAPVEPDLLAAAIAAGDFDRMKQLEIENGIPGHAYDRTDNKALRMRKGQVGGFTEHLSEAEAERIQQLCREGLSDKAKAMFERAGLVV